MVGNADWVHVAVPTFENCLHFPGSFMSIHFGLCHGQVKYYAGKLWFLLKSSGEYGWLLVCFNRLGLVHITVCLAFCGMRFRYHVSLWSLYYFVCMCPIYASTTQRLVWWYKIWGDGFYSSSFLSLYLLLDLFCSVHLQLSCKLDIHSFMHSFIALLGIETKIFCLLAKRSTTELYLQIWPWGFCWLILQLSSLQNDPAFWKVVFPLCLFHWPKRSIFLKTLSKVVHFQHSWGWPWGKALREKWAMWLPSPEHRLSDHGNGFFLWVFHRPHLCTALAIVQPYNLESESGERKKRRTISSHSQGSLFWLNIFFQFSLSASAVKFCSWVQSEMQRRKNTRMPFWSIS